MAEGFEATIVQHSFEHYGAQRNWAIENLPATGRWQLHLDADEWMDDILLAAIRELADEPDHSFYFLALGDQVKSGHM